MGRYAPSLTTSERLHPSRTTSLFDFSRLPPRGKARPSATSVPGARIGLGGIAAVMSRSRAGIENGHALCSFRSARFCRSFDPVIGEGAAAQLLRVARRSVRRGGRRRRPTVLCVNQDGLSWSRSFIDGSLLWNSGRGALSSAPGAPFVRRKGKTNDALFASWSLPIGARDNDADLVASLARQKKSSDDAVSVV
jgi:hypothetical protein